MGDRMPELLILILIFRVSIIGCNNTWSHPIRQMCASTYMMHYFCQAQGRSLKHGNSVGAVLNDTVLYISFMKISYHYFCWYHPPLLPSVVFKTTEVLTLITITVATPSYRKSYQKRQQGNRKYPDEVTRHRSLHKKRPTDVLSHFPFLYCPQDHRYTTHTIHFCTW